MRSLAERCRQKNVVVTESVRTQSLSRWDVHRRKTARQSATTKGGDETRIDVFPKANTSKHSSASKSQHDIDVFFFSSGPSIIMVITMVNWRSVWGSRRPKMFLCEIGIYRLPINTRLWPIGWDGSVCIAYGGVYHWRYIRYGSSTRRDDVTYYLREYPPTVRKGWYRVASW